MDYNQTDIKRMFEAIQMSATSSSKGNAIPEGGPFGAVIYKGDKCIGQSYNHVLVDNDPTAHAEVHTIRQACKNINSFDLSGCVLYSSCEPCPMCLMACKWANLDKVYFAATRKDAATIGFRDDDLYNMLKEGVFATPIPECREEAIKAMQDWYTKFQANGNY